MVRLGVGACLCTPIVQQLTTGSLLYLSLTSSTQPNNNNNNNPPRFLAHINPLSRHFHSNMHPKNAPLLKRGHTDTVTIFSAPPRHIQPTGIFPPIPFCCCQIVLYKRLLSVSFWQVIVGGVQYSSVSTHRMMTNFMPSSPIPTCWRCDVHVWKAAVSTVE